MEEFIPVSTSGGAYTVRFGVGRRFFECLPDVIAEISTSRPISRIVAIVDEVLVESVRPTLAAPIPIISVFGSETAKSCESKNSIEEQLFNLGCDKNTVLIAIGGGTIGDLVGFVSATFLRGIRYVQIPTTLLAMVDSSVGGKTAINTNKGKNMIGAFHQPSAVIADTDFLDTLDERQFANGMAEIVKAGFVGDVDVWSLLAEIPNISWLRDAEKKAVLISLIVAAIQYKKRVIEQDERDNGIRNELNFGHTVGHALELLDDCNLLHGECVAIGMIYELLCLRAVDHLDNPADISTLESMLTKFGLPVKVPPSVITEGTFERVQRLLLGDKKASTVDEGVVPIVAVKRLGEAVGYTRTLPVPLLTVMRVISPFVSVVSQMNVNSRHVLTLPGSKSVANRALLLAAISGKPCRLINVPDSADVILMFNALNALGYKLEMKRSTVDVIETDREFKQSTTKTIHVGNSGTTARFLLPVISLVLATGEKGLQSVSITCDPRMAERPIKDLLNCLREAFPSIYIKFDGTQEDHFPLTLWRDRTKNFNKHASQLTIDGSLSSQFVSGLLMMAPLYPSPLKVMVAGLKANGEAVSQPFIDMTVRMIEIFGGTVVKVSNGIYTTDSKRYSGVSTVEYAIPGDAAAASYPLAMAALTCGSVTVNVVNDGLQEDYRFVSLLSQMGCEVLADTQSTTVRGPPELTLPDGFEVDMSACTDTFLTASVLMAVCGKGRITSIENQRVKECDRISAMAQNLSKCGFKIREHSDGIEFFGNTDAVSNTTFVACETFNDHRVAMAMAVLGCLIPNVRIENPRSVEKTFPYFWDMLCNDLNLTVQGSPISDTRYPDIVAVIGMRGIGKSTTGRLASEKLACAFYDLDNVIIEREKASIDEIIGKQGWTKFREIECAALKQILCDSVGRPTLVSCGGGIIGWEESRRTLAKIKTVVWLRSLDDATTIQAAIEATKHQPGYVDEVEKVFARRKPLYVESSNTHLYSTRDPGGLETAVDHLADIFQNRHAGRSDVPTEGSMFVCLTASSYSEWTGDDFAKAIGDSTSVTAVEMRLDKLSDINEFIADFRNIRKKVAVPIILTLRTFSQGGSFSGNYLAIIQKIVRIDPEWIDVEIAQTDAAAWIREEAPLRRTRFIASRHYTTVPPLDTAVLTNAVLAVAEAPWASVGKICYSAKSAEDCARLTACASSISDRVQKPVVAVCTGAAGLVSRILNKVWTPVCSSWKSRLPEAAPLQLDQRQLTLLKSGSVIPGRFTFHLFGNPITLSPSPYMHNLMFALKGLAGECFYSACCGNSLADVVGYITADSFRGASVTIPLKELVFSYLKESQCELSEDAKLAGAVNTVSLTKSGALRGDNTDIIALRQVIQTFGNWCRTCLIVGTGGAARGAIVAVKSFGFSSIYVEGRTLEKVQPLVDQFGVVPLVAAAGPIDVVIGCIPSAGHKDFLSKHPTVIGPTTTVVELAYTPKVTPLVQAALKVGAQVVYGSEILIRQGIAQHDVWLSSLRARNEFSGYSIGAPSTELISQQLEMYSPQ